MRSLSRRAAVAAIGFGLLAALGCGGSGRPTPVPVSGKVLFKKSTPAAGALVVFHPPDLETEKRLGGKPVATVGEDGTFKLTMYEDGDGAPEGEYGVTIDWRKKGKEAKLSLGSEGAGGTPMLNPKYSNPQQPFTKVTVKKGEKNEFVFEVD